ncbi:S8 family serine peptidase [Candidatus Uhrbacteria bacterium]|nr:S8 family serine peptidase [Candidatus Uhrbacteria bacterium]
MRRTRTLLLTTYYLLLTTVAFPALAAPYYPADPDAFSRQWHLAKIGAYEAWSRVQGSREVVVAVIDTGVDLDHPDLKENLWVNPGERLNGRDDDGNIYIDDINGWDFIDGDNDPSPNVNEDGARAQAINHGTIVAGLIGAVGNNGIGGAGVALKVKIMPLRALDSSGRGNVATVIEAVRYAIDKGAHIINLSFVGPGFETQLFLILQEALQKGILVVAAVGNSENGSGTNLDVSPLYPVCYTGSGIQDVVLGVAALDDTDKKFRFSNYGANCVDISAPGVNMYGTVYHQPSQGFERLFEGGFTGSSMAAPLVSGAAALLKALNPALRVQDLRSLILQSADSIEGVNPEYSGKLGHGRLNIGRAVELASSGATTLVSAVRGIPYILAAPFSQGKPEVTLSLSTGSSAGTFSAYADNFRGGVRVAAGDIDGDGSQEIVAGAGFGGGPHVRVFESNGTVVGSFFAYDPRFRGGVNVAVGDLNGNGIAEIVTAAGPGGGPHIRIFDAQGNVLGSFFAYDKHLRGGVQLAVGDLDGDGVSEIIAAPGKGTGYGGEVRVFDARGNLKRRLQAYPSNFTGGVNVAAGDLDGDGRAEIVTAPIDATSPEVRVYSAEGSWLRAFLAYQGGYQGGVNVAVGDVDGDGISEIITGPGRGGGPHVVVFDGFGKMKQQFFPLDASFRGGVSVGIIKL